MSSSKRPPRRPVAGLPGVLLALATVTCAAGPTEPAPWPERVLFIGNSLTYVNDLPRMVQALSLAAGHQVTVATIAQPNFALEDHWDRAEVHRTIAEGDWDVVVLQQGPSALASSREELRLWTRRFARPIRDAGAEPALYMVWPSASRLDDFPRVSETYRLAARDVDGMLLPAGDAWLEAWRRDAALQLYGPDGFHPSQAGTYLAALTIVAGLYDRGVVGLPATLELAGGGSVAIPPATAAVLQTAASAVRDATTSSIPDRDR